MRKTHGEAFKKCTIFEEGSELRSLQLREGWAEPFLRAFMLRVSMQSCRGNLLSAYFLT